jgi:hypothetical protein
MTAETQSVTITARDALFITDVLHLARRFLIRAHPHDAGSRRSVAGLARDAAALLPPGSPWTTSDHDEHESPLI